MKKKLNKDISMIDLLSTQHAAGGSTGGDPRKELVKRLASQGISIQYGFDGKPQYYKNGKMLTGKAAGDAALLHSKTSTQLKQKQTAKGIIDGSQSTLAQLFDITGISGWGDLKKTVIDGWDKTSKVEKGLAILGATPGLTALKKPVTAVKAASKIAKATEKVAPTAKKVISKSYIPTKQDVKNIVDKNKKAISSPGYAQRRMKTTGESLEQVQKQVKKYSDLEKKTKKVVSDPGGSILDDAEGVYINGFFDKGVYIANNLNEGKALNTLDHEIKHLFSPTLKSGAKKLYENYPRLDLEGIPKTGPAAKLTKGDISYLNMPEEQQVRFFRLNEKIRKDLNLPDFNYEPLEEADFNKWVSDYNIDSLTGDYGDVKDLLTTYVSLNSDKGIPNEQTRKKIFETLNKAWLAAPVGLGLGLSEMSEATDGNIKNEEFNYANGGTVNNTNMKKKIPQYAAGGPILDYIKSPSTALQENQLAWAKAKAEGALDPMAQVVDLAGPILALAGQVAVDQELFPGTSGKKEKEDSGEEPAAEEEKQAASGISTNSNKKLSVEGGEILESPDGKILKMKGPKHEQGGIPLEISPEGLQKGNYNVYSDRISGITGKTLAREKEEREKKIKRYEEHIKKFPGDMAARNTLDRLRKSSKLADQQAVDLQAQIQDAKNMGVAETEVDAPQESMTENIQAATGISTGDATANPLLLPLLLQEVLGTGTPGVPPVPPAVAPPPAPVIGGDTDPALVASINATVDANKASQTTKNNSVDMPLTTGDIIGSLGLISQRLTARNAAANNIGRLDLETNSLNRYGADAVRAEQNKQILSDITRDRAVQEARLNSVNTQDALTSSGRGINELTAGMIASQQALDRANQSIDDRYTQESVNNQASYTKLLQDIQDKYLNEERAVQDRNEQRLDMAQSVLDNANVQFAGLPADIGKIINDSKLRQVMAKNVSAQSKYANVDSQGGMTGKSQTPGTTPIIQDVKDFLTDWASKQKAVTETSEKAEASATNPDTGIAQGNAVTPTENRIIGNTFYNDFGLDANRAKINNLLQEVQAKNPGFMLDTTSIDSVKAFQRIVGAKDDGKFGANTYQALLKYVAGMTGKQYDPSTGLIFKEK